MDFVVVGLGLGTLAILAGVLLLGWVAGRWERAAARAAEPEDAAYDYAVAAERRGAGQAFAGAGAAVLIATIGALAGSLDDQTGAFFVATAASVAALGLLVWAYLYRIRNPLPPRRRTRPVSVEAAGGGEAVRGPASPVILDPASLAVADDAPFDDRDAPRDLVAEEIAPSSRESEPADPTIVPSPESPTEVELLGQEASPLDDERVEDDEDTQEAIPDIEPILAPASTGVPELAPEDEEDGDDAGESARAQRNLTMSGVDEAPFALHEDDGKVRRDREF